MFEATQRLRAAQKWQHFCKSILLFALCLSQALSLAKGAAEEAVPAWVGIGRIDPNNRYVIRSSYAGFVQRAPQVGQLTHGVFPKPTVTREDAISRTIQSSVKDNSIATIISPAEEQSQERWLKRMSDLESALHELNMERPDRDAGESPSAYTYDTQQRSRFDLISAEIVRAFPSINRRPTAPLTGGRPPVQAPPPPSGEKFDLFADLNKNLAGSEPTKKLSEFLKQLAQYPIWNEIGSRPEALGMLRSVLLASLREEFVPDGYFSKSPYSAWSLKANSLLLFEPVRGIEAQPNAVMLRIAPLVGGPTDAWPLRYMQSYWTYVRDNGLMNASDLEFLRRLGLPQANNAFDAMPSVNAFLAEIKRGLDAIDKQRAWLVWPGASWDPDLPQNTQGAVFAAIANNANTMPEIEGASVADRAALINYATLIAQRAWRDDPHDPATLEWAWRSVRPALAGFRGRLLVVQEAPRNSAPIIKALEAFVGTKPFLFREIPISSSYRPGALFGMDYNPMLAESDIRFWRYMVSLSTTVEYARASNRLSDLRRASETIAATEADLAAQDLIDGRRMQRDWREAEEALRNAATSYQDGQLVLSDDATVEESLVKAGQDIGEGSELAIVRPINSQRLILDSGAAEFLRPGSHYKVKLDCGSAVALTPIQRKNLTGGKGNSGLLKEIGAVQADVRGSLRFDAHVVDMPSAQGAAPVLQIDLPKELRGFWRKVSEPLARRAADSGFLVMADGGNWRVSFEAGVLESDMKCSATLWFADSAAVAFSEEFKKWRSIGSPR